MEHKHETMTVWVVAHEGCEHYAIQGIYASYDKAFAAWNKVRLEILAIYKEFVDDPDDPDDNSWCQEHIDNLSDENPITCHDSYYDQPSLYKHEVIL